MAVTCLNDNQKRAICKYYEMGHTQDHLSSVYCVSRRTIQRILDEEGVLRPHNPRTYEENQILKVAKQHNLDAAGLKSLLSRRSARFPTQMTHV